MSTSISSVKIQQHHALVAPPRPIIRLVHVVAISGHGYGSISRAYGCRRQRKVSTKRGSLRTMGWPKFEYARAQPFHGRGALEVRKLVERGHSAPLRALREVVPRVYAAKYARACIFHAVHVLASAAAGSWATIISPSTGCPARVRPLYVPVTCLYSSFYCGDANATINGTPGAGSRARLREVQARYLHFHGRNLSVIFFPA